MKVREPGLSLVCYHWRRGLDECPVSLFHSLPENSATGASRAEQHFQQLTEEHEPPTSEAEWVQANASLMREMGSERWLRKLLDVLGGDIVTAEEVGLAPPGGAFGYGAPGRSNAQRRGKKKRKKRHHR